ncbi:polysaccharide deacetylase family protein [Gillisia sp. M10.2A]|uniref:Polysaccharide deacetylase family protein n=1 Tax=Gillisia lutea TaxID=2909668 RepID=A0ABS9EFI2_9FLAO|nr:polysaccharide deacetylase family protein [Gillisia lutea]MCF4101635.1 polysaccharide deacetylase family protein [Gillisia lutea]
MLAILILGGIGAYFYFILFWLILGVAVGYTTFLLLVSSNIQFNFFVNAYHNNPEVSQRQVAITFDDGPVENTLKILEVLKKYDVKASFFCIGKNIEANPHIFNKILEEGHFIGNHTFSHTKKMGFLSRNKIIQEIQECDKTAFNVGGIKPNTFRPPFGIINPKIKAALEVTGHKVIGWNLRSYDTIVRSEKLILNRITSRIKPGDVVLLHDRKEHTVVILEQLLIFLQTNDFTACRVDNLFKIDAYT